VNFQETKTYLLSKPDAILDFPFGPETAVFKVRNKMFATLVETEGQAWSNLKCDPTEALMLRDIFPEVRPGYHMNKKHWNTIELQGNLPQSEIERMIDNSYTLVVKSLPLKVRQSLEIQYGSDAVYR
jgi:predicted DNA-binding protein (MmcQ/YjbR family)